MTRPKAFIYIVILALILSQTNAYSSTLQLSAKERDWVKSHPTIRISGPQAFPPFQYSDADGSLKGMASDYLYYISEMVGFEIETAPKQPWPAILSAIKNKEIDLLTCAAETKDRSSYLNYTTPHLSFPLVIVSRKSYPYIDGLHGLHNKKIAVIKKNATIEWLQRDKLQVNFHYVDSPFDALNSVSTGGADATIQNLAAATYLITKYGLTNLKIASPTSYGNYSLSIAIRKDWPELTSIINKALKAIPFEEHNRIRSRWISVAYEEGLFSLATIMKWLVVAFIVVLTIFFFFYYWNRKLAQEILERQKVEEVNQKLIHELKTAFSEIHTLQGILPICSHCKKIRDDKGIWSQIEIYVSKHSDAEFSHGICQECAKLHYPEFVSAELPEK